jgi:serine protease Do
VPLLRKLVLTYRLPQQSGVLVAKVEPGSPALAAGVHEGDVIVSFDGETAPRIEALHRLLTADRIGRVADLRVLRGVELLTLHVTPREMPAAA